MAVRTKRIYEPPAKSDGYRVLVDRIWPRGVSRDQAAVDEWAREIAPSTELRRWFGHDASRFDEFRRRYAQELQAHEEQLQRLRERVQGAGHPATLATRHNLASWTGQAGDAAGARDQYAALLPLL